MVMRLNGNETQAQWEDTAEAALHLFNDWEETVPQECSLGIMFALLHLDVHFYNKAIALTSKFSRVCG